MRLTLVPVVMVVSLFALASVALVPSRAQAEVMISAQEVRSYDAPAGLDPNALSSLSTANGVTVLYSSVGADRNIACAVIVAAGESAKVIEYKHEGRATQCIGLLPHPKGGFFMRGSDPTALGDEVTAFTAYIDEQGVLKWSVSDQQLIDAKASADRGTGEFIGVYDSPHPALVYSEGFDRLLAFTQGNLVIGSQMRPLTQAHVINVETGRLTVTGQTFGGNGLGVVGGTAQRLSDGYFLLYFYSEGTEGAFFYSFNGRNKISGFKPLQESWETRIVTKMTYGPGERLGLLWTPNAQADADTRISLVNDAGAALWQGQWPSSELTAKGQVELGQPREMWVGQEHVLVLYAVGQALKVRVIDAKDGTSLGVADLDGVSPYAPLAILNGESGSLKLLAIDQDNGRFHEYRLDFMDLPDVMPGELDMGMDMPAEIPAPPTLPEVGCGCSSGSSPSADLGALGLLLFGLVGLGRRQRRR